MVLNKYLLIFFIAVFSISSIVYAQDEELVPGFFIDKSFGEIKIFQRLVWEKDENALNYEAVIQRYNEGFRTFQTHTTENIYLDVSLPPGRYRFVVTPFDFLNRRGDASEWRSFEVLAAYEPKIIRFLPENFNLDQFHDRILYIDGINLLRESEIYLTDGFKQLYPVKISIFNNRRAVLEFDTFRLTEGSYDIYVLNPGGLDTKAGRFGVRYKKPLDIFFKMAWKPAIPVFGELNDLFGANLFIPGYSLGVEAVSSYLGGINGGIEFEGSVYMINPAVSFRLGYDKLIDGFNNAQDGALIIDCNFNVVFQRRFNYRKNIFTMRAGCGFTSVTSSGNYEPDDDFALSLNIGFSFLNQIHDILYLDLGIDGAYYVSGLNSALLRPRIGLAWKF